MVKLHEKLVSFDNLPGGELVIKSEQYIPDDFIRDCQIERADSLHTPAGDRLHRVARIPTSKIDEWGWDWFLKAPATEVLKRLRIEQMDGFITSNKV